MTAQKQKQSHLNDASALRARVQGFVRSFGLLDDAETPCGQPLQASHAHALMLLLDQKDPSEPLRHKDLALALGLDKSSVVRLCRRMEQVGHVLQEPAKDDRRAREVRLTAKGKRLAHTVEAASLSHFERVLTAVPRAERVRVIAALEVLNTAMDGLRSRESTR